MLSISHERKLLAEGYTRIIGIDEVGRGCWAGPVAVGAFVFDQNTKFHRNIDDSKQLTKEQREQTYQKLFIYPHKVSFGSVEQINEVGVGKTIESLIVQLVAEFNSSGSLFLIDGKFSQNFGSNTRKIVKGDATYYSIAAASILAKVERDRLMQELDGNYSSYGFAKHKGYGTKSHREAISLHGVCDLHRLSFKPLEIFRSQVSLNI